MLRVARESRRWTRADLVDEFAKAASRLGYRGFSVTERQIQRWEGPTPPVPRPAQATVLEAIFGLSLAELGLVERKNSVELGVQDQPEWSPGGTIESFSAALDDSGPPRREFLLSGSALSAFAFRYFASRSMTVANILPSTQRVGQGDVDRIKNTIDDLRTLDTQLGSGDLVRAGRVQCALVFDLLKTHSYSDDNGKKLFSLAADIAGFTGWLLFDTGHDAEAQRFFRLALQAARHADDDIMASTVLAFMSIQKYNLCEWDDSLLLATAAQRLAGRYDCPHVMASLLTRQARALAGKRDKRGCYAAVEESFEWYDKGPGSDHPDYVDWVSLGELHGQASGCAALLGDTDRAVMEFSQARNHYGPDSFRSSSLHMLRLAHGFASSGAIEESCAFAADALNLGKLVRSYRFDEVKGDLAWSLQSYKSSPRVKDLIEQHRALATPRLPRSALYS